MSTLEDLKERFGAKMLLSAADVAEVLGTTAAAVYKLKERGTLPVAKKYGSKVCVPIRALAEWLDEGSEPENAPAVRPRRANAEKPTANPRRSRAAIAKAIGAAFKQSWEARMAQIHFEQEVFAHIEAAQLRAELDKA